MKNTQSLSVDSPVSEPQNPEAGYKHADGSTCVRIAGRWMQECTLTHAEEHRSAQADAHAHRSAERLSMIKGAQARSWDEAHKEFCPNCTDSAHANPYRDGTEADTW